MKTLSLAGIASLILLVACGHAASPGSGGSEMGKVAASPSVSGVSKTYTSKEGWRYSVNVSFTKFDPSQSPLGCEDTQPPGRTNAWFTIAVTNLLTDRAAPFPPLGVGNDLNENGSAVNANAMTSFEGGANLHEVLSNVELSPSTSTYCLFAHQVVSTDGQISAGGYTTFTAVMGSVSDPAPPGTALLVSLGSSEDSDRQYFEVPASN